MANTLSPLKDMLENPRAHFNSPEEVLATDSLSKGQKKQILDAWEEDSRRLSVATEEGMGGGEPSLMADVADAKAELGVVESRKPAPTKAG